MCDAEITLVKRSEDGQAPNTNEIPLEGYDAASEQRLRYTREIRKQKRKLFFWTIAGASSEEDKRGLRLLALGKQCAEVGVGRDNDTILSRCTRKDVAVWRSLHPILAHHGLRHAQRYVVPLPREATAHCL